MFRVTEPAGKEAAVVVEVPHAGLAVDPLSMATLTAPVRSLGGDADLYVDELYQDAPKMGATLLVSELSRYVCDLNRSENNVDPLAVRGGTDHSAPHGLIWRRTTEGLPALSGTLPASELDRRLNCFYRPYHARLRELIAQKVSRFGHAIVLAAHSMPSRGRAGHGDTGRRRADVVPGSRGFTTAARAVVQVPDHLASRRGWSVAHDDPYRGGFTTAHYGMPSSSVHAVQVELSRALYMDEVSLEQRPPEFARVREYCSELVESLCRLGPKELAAGSFD